MIRFENINGMPSDDLLCGILTLHEEIFEDSRSLVTRMTAKRGLLVTVAVDEDSTQLHDPKVVGYKIGYELDTDSFYSWLGGVDGRYRNQGIASKLMLCQHEFLLANGYRVVETRTKNKWRSMLILNIKNGFDVVGTYTDETGEPKIILKKKL